MEMPPLVRILPFTKSKKPLKPGDTALFSDGLLAWGNMDTARHYGGLFDDLIITAEEFPFHDPVFIRNVLCNPVRQPPVKVYHVPISEELKGNVVREENSISQTVFQITCQQTGQALKTLTNPPVRSNQIIMNSLMMRRRVLVVCMAGRNRSTATILRFLVLLSARRDVDTNTATNMIVDAYHHGKPGSTPWSCEEWEHYLMAKRDYEIFPLNRVQIENLCHTIREINLDLTQVKTKKTSSKLKSQKNLLDTSSRSKSKKN